MSHDHESRFRRIIRSHTARYPLMECPDIYKLIYQAAMGSAHIINSFDAAMEYLSDELNSMGCGPLEPVVDIISHDGCISRINLRPYLESGYDPENLAAAFIRTGKEFTGSTEVLELYCSWLTSMQEESLLSVDLQDISQYLDEMSESGYQAAHHSSVYRNAYSPSYRVIASALIIELGIIQ